MQLEAKQSDPSWWKILGGRDVVVVSPQYWGDLWVSKHWIAHELSERCRVLFVEPPVWVTGVARRPWQSRSAAPRLWRPLRRIRENLFVFTPKLYPRLLKARTVDTPGQIREAMGKLGMRQPIVLNFDTDPRAVAALEGMVSVYYCVDPVMSVPTEFNDERRTCEESDLIYAVSDAYRDHLAGYRTGKPIHVIPHGYAYEHARRVDEDPASEVPQELKSLPRPILGFVGSIHDSNIDLDRLERIATELPLASIVLIGPHKNNPIGASLSAKGLARIRALPNVHLLGPRHFLEIPRYVKYFDVGLVLINTKDFDAAEKTSKRTLFKWLLYLTMGKPAVAPLMSEAATIGNIVYLSKNDDEYTHNIHAALNEPGYLKEQRIRYASQFSFDNVLDRIAQPLVPLMAERPAVASGG
jgi:hypothetical protein